MKTQYRVVVARQVEDYIAKNSRFISQCMQLDKGPFFGKTEVLYHPAINISRRYSSRTIVEQGRLPNNLRAFNFYTSDKPYFSNGIQFAAGDVAARKSGDAFISITCAGCQYHTVVVNDQYAKKNLSEEEWQKYNQLNKSVRSVRLHSAQQLSTIVATMNSTLDDLAQGKLLSSDKDAVQGIHHELLQNIVLIIEESGIHKDRVNAHQRFLFKASKVVMETRVKTITVEELAKKVGTSRRNLEHVFQTNLGISPKQFLLNVRLNRIRSDLLQHINSSAAAIAKRFGINHLGHFSGAYKSLFEELPSETRARAAAAIHAIG